MKLLKKLTLIFVAVLICCSTCFLAVGCGTEDKTTIELNEVTHSIFYAPLYVAINNGYFEEEGLTINLTNGGGSNTSMSALLTGSADIILAGPETVDLKNPGNGTTQHRKNRSVHRMKSITQVSGGKFVGHRGVTQCDVFSRNKVEQNSRQTVNHSGGENQQQAKTQQKGSNPLLSAIS